MSGQVNALAGDLSELFNEMVDVEVVLERDQPQAKLTVCHMSYYRRSDSASHNRRVRQTAVVLDAADMDLPQFILAPQPTGMLGAVFNTLAGGMGQIGFQDSPEFSSSYFLQGWSEEPVRVLFTPEVRDHFAARPGWSVRGKGNRLVIFRHNQLCSGDELQPFVSDSLEILAALRKGEQELDARPQIRRATTHQDVIATADRMGGLVGDMLRRQLQKFAVTREELETFLGETPPRNIPAGLKRQVLGDNFMLIPVGGVFVVAGVVAGSVLLALATGPDRVVGVVLGLSLLIFLPLVGGLMVALTIRHRGRKGRVLTHGSLVDGTITGVKRTSTAVNNQIRHHVTVRYSADGEERTTTCNAYGQAADLARTFAASGQPVRVLVDPANREHVVCADLVMLMD